MVFAGPTLKDERGLLISFIQDVILGKDIFNDRKQLRKDIIRTIELYNQGVTRLSLSDRCYLEINVGEHTAQWRDVKEEFFSGRKFGVGKFVKKDYQTITLTEVKSDTRKVVLAYNDNNFDRPMTWTYRPAKEWRDILHAKLS